MGVINGGASSIAGGGGLCDHFLSVGARRGSRQDPWLFIILVTR